MAKIICWTETEVEQVTGPKALWYDMGRIVVLTGEDMETEAPIEVTAWQLRKAMNHLGIRSDVEMAVDSAGNQDLIDGWNYSETFRSDNPMVLMIAAAIGKDTPFVAELFNLARGL